MTAKVTPRDQVVRCPECGSIVARHTWLVAGDRVAYGGLVMVAGMVSTGRRSYGPPASSRPRPRTADRLMVRTPGPVIVRCPMPDCRTAQSVDVPA